MERKRNRVLRLLEQLGAWVHGRALDSTKERRLHLHHSVQRGDLALAGVTSSAYALGWDLYLNPAWEYPASGRLATAADPRAEPQPGIQRVPAHQCKPSVRRSGVAAL